MLGKKEGENRVQTHFSPLRFWDYILNCGIYLFIVEIFPFSETKIKWETWFGYAVEETV